MSAPVPSSRRSRLVIAGALTAGLICSLTAAPALAVSDDPDMFCDLPGQELAISPIDQLEEGEAVTWSSTVKGTTPTTFSGEYVGKLDNGLGADAEGNPRDLLLVKLDGEVVNGAEGSLAAGVWAGASGSPVYDADGALIGAVSYGFSFLPDNVAGVTPAAYMKTIGKLPSVQTLDSAEKKQVARMADEKVTSQTSSYRRLEPVRVTSGASAGALDEAAASIAQRVPGYRGVAAIGREGAAAASDGADLPIVPGGNIAVSYAYGAVGDASVGTVTAVCGDEVFAYGHPGSWNSKLTANFHGASAARVVPDLTGAYKLVASIGKVKGRLVDDRLAGVRGILGDGAPTVAIRTTGIVGSVRSSVVTHVSEDQLIPAAAYAQMYNEVPRMLDNVQEGSAKVNWSISYRRADGSVRKLNNTNAYADPAYLPEYIGQGVADDIALLQQNPFEDIEILAVAVSATYDADYRKTALKGVQIRSGNTWKTLGQDSVTKVTRGTTYDFRAVLTSVRGAKKETVYAPFAATVPTDAQKIVRFTLASPDAEDHYYEEDPYGDLFMEPGSFGEYVKILDANTRNDVFDRVRAYATVNGKRTWKTWPTAAPTVVEADGARATFRLEVAPKR